MKRSAKKLIIRAFVVLTVVLMLPAVSLAANESSSAAVTRGAFDAAMFHSGSPTAVIVDKDGAYLIADMFNKVIWRLVPGEDPEIFVGRIVVLDLNGENTPGYNDSGYEDAAFASPWAFAPFRDGYLVSDPDNNAVRWFGDGKVLSAIGSGLTGYKDGWGLTSEFSHPTGLAADGKGGVYIADTGNNRIRYMDPNGNVTTVTGDVEGSADGAAINLRTAFQRLAVSLCAYYTP